MIDKHKTKKARIQLRVETETKLTLRSKAEQCNMSLSDYIVRCGLQQHISPPKSNIDQECVRELSRIGNNLNQIAHVLNSAQEPASLNASLQNIADELKQLRSLI